MTIRITKQEYAALLAKPKKSKYNNRKKVVDGITFHSSKEAKRWQALNLMQQADQIWDLQRQVPYRIEMNGKHICTWFADFTYMTQWGQAVEDVKGFRTGVYRLKRKLVQAQYSIKILET